jgi:hypothetical protein
MKINLTILAVFALLGFPSVPPCGGAEAVTNNVLWVQPTVQVWFNATTNTMYTIYTAESLTGEWTAHPGCDHRIFATPKVFKLWDDPSHAAQFFRLEIFTTQVTPQPPSPNPVAGAGVPQPPGEA